MLALSQVGFRYPKTTRAVLEDVSLTLRPAELTCVVGPNGAGKTTLLRVAAGLVAPTSGTVRFGDADPRQIPRRTLARRLAFLPQDYAMAFPFTVAEVVLMGRYPHHGPFGLERAEDLRLAETAMRRCDVEDLANRRFDSLSGGERRRALLAQAFCQAAELLLLDEPTAALDPPHALAVFQLLVEEKATAMVVTHDLNLAGRFAHRLVLVNQGRIAGDGPPIEVLASAQATEAFGALHVGKLPGGAPFVVPL